MWYPRCSWCDLMIKKIGYQCLCSTHSIIIYLQIFVYYNREFNTANYNWWTQASLIVYCMMGTMCRRSRESAHCDSTIFVNLHESKIRRPLFIYWQASNGDISICSSVMLDEFHVVHAIPAGNTSKNLARSAVPHSLVSGHENANDLNGQDTSIWAK